MTSHRKHNAGRLTLLELLVTIAVIAILMTLLLPALKTVKGKAVHLSCRNNLKGMSLSICYYADDYNGFWPGSGVINSNDFRALGGALSRTTHPFSGYRILGYPNILCTGYLCPATIPRWGMTLVAGQAKDKNDSDSYDHLSYPGCYSTSIASDTNFDTRRSNISLRRVEAAGSTASGGPSNDPYRGTPTSRLIMICDYGFTYDEGSGGLPLPSDHADGKWNAVFLDGHASFSATPNRGRTWQTIFTTP